MTAVLLAALAMPSVITEASLLAQYADLDRLMSPPAPRETAFQFSSYDRNSKSPGNEAWFANADAGKYVREETTGGRTERVMVDIQGPGAVVRIWSANPAGTLRFYFDGEASPRWTVPAQDLLSGKAPGMGDPFAYVASRGWNLYYPIPYAKSLKVTAEGAGTEHMYYQVGCRTFAAGTKIVTFDPKSRPSVAAASVRKRLDPSAAERPRRGYVLGKNQVQSIFDERGPAVIRTLSLRVYPKPGEADLPWSDPKRAHHVLRQLRLVGHFDGERCIDVPVGDFFGAAPGINPYATLPMQVDESGLMTCRFPMPFARSASLMVVNGNGFPVEIEFRISSEKIVGAAPPYRFKAQWLSNFLNSRPMRDMEMLHVEGEGWLVGSMLAIENPRPEWWGEGDEKIYVDGEAFPSFFGTGTEDFYGYAWCWPDKFTRAFHAQPRCDGPGNFGHTSVNRWFVADAIPFRKSLKFDLELWHWAICDVKFSRVSYWYARPGGTSPKEVDASLLPPRELVPNPPVKGAIEGEELRVLSRLGGELEAQGGFFDLSKGKQLWWKGMKAGDMLVLEVPVAQPGRYEVIGNFCRNRDYGKHRITLLGSSVEIDFFHTSLIWEKKSLGTFDISGPTFTLSVQSLGKREEALQGGMFGLDYLLLERR